MVTITVLNKKAEYRDMEVLCVERHSFEHADLLQKENKGEDTELDDICAEEMLVVLSYINKEYAQNLTLESVSKQFFMNPSHLSRVFKKSVGLTFSDYLRRYRIQKAIELMKENDKNITEISMAVGFSSVNHFCKTFRALIHESPLKYKKQYLRQQDKNKIE